MINRWPNTIYTYFLYSCPPCNLCYSHWDTLQSLYHTPLHSDRFHSALDNYIHMYDRHILRTKIMVIYFLLGGWISDNMWTFFYLISDLKAWIRNNRHLYLINHCAAQHFFVLKVWYVDLFHLWNILCKLMLLKYGIHIYTI